MAVLTQSLLSFISILDSYGVQTWNLRAVAATSALVLYVISLLEVPGISDIAQFLLSSGA